MANVLTHSPATIIRQLLIDLGLGVESEYTGDAYTGGDWPVFTSIEPDAPDQVITAFDTAGRSDGRRQIDGGILTHWGFQLRFRSKDHPTGWMKADEVRRALSEDVYQTTVTVDDESYQVHAVTGIGNPIPFGKGVPGISRLVLSLNAMAVIKAI